MGREQLRKGTIMSDRLQKWTRFVEREVGPDLAGIEQELRYSLRMLRRAQRCDLPLVAADLLARASSALERVEAAYGVDEDLFESVFGTDEQGFDGSVQRLADVLAAAAEPVDLCRMCPACDCYSDDGCCQNCGTGTWSVVPGASSYSNSILDPRD
jgi:hypothetical protein